MTLYAAMAEHLRNGSEHVTFRPSGTSMTPLVKSGEKVTVTRLTPEDAVDIGDIVLAKVKGRVYLHLVTAIDDRGRIQISNNHGHVNGWTSRDKVYGRLK